MLNRENIVKKFWGRSKELALKNKQYQNYLQKFWYFLLKEDIGMGDITTNTLIKTSKKISAVVVAKEDGIFAGAEEFAFLNKDLAIKLLKRDGDEIKCRDGLISIEGSAVKILERERLSLNLLQRMSGIATLTNGLVKKLNDKVRIAATRKTLCGSLDKKAVSIGGGLTHRLNLSDGVLIKDNHLKIMNGDIGKALRLAKDKSKYVEIEVESKEQALEAAQSIAELKSKSPFAIMLDKIPPKEIKSIIEELKDQDLYEHVLLEASGNIKPGNLTDYADSGVDIISMGFITNSATALDMSMEIIK